MGSLWGRSEYRHLFAAQVSALLGTGLATVALGLLSYQLAGADAGAVLGTALTVKMVAYVTVAPLAAAYADRLPRRTLLVGLDLMRAGVVALLPFVDQAWQIYLLIAVLQSTSAAFTPTFQAVLPDLLPDERDYTRALAASQTASTMESLFSPVLAAVLLSVIGFHWLFAGTALGFVASATLVVTTQIPDAPRSTHTGAFDRTAAGLRLFATIPRLRGLMGLNLVVAAAGAMVLVDSVGYVRDTLGGSPSDVAIALAANGFGVIPVAVLLPRLLARVRERPVMLAGAVLLLVGLGAAILLSLAHSGGWRWPLLLTIWALIGAGTGLILTPAGRVLRRSAPPEDRPAVFAAQFSLSHLCWLVAYPIAGFLSTATDVTITWLVLAGLAGVGLWVAARRPAEAGDRRSTERALSRCDE